MEVRPVRESPRKRMGPAQVVPSGVDRGRGPTGSADVETRHVRRGTSRYSVSRDREEETAEGKKSEGPGRAGAFTWWGLGMSAVYPFCGVRVRHIGERHLLPCR